MSDSARSTDLPGRWRTLAETLAPFSGAAARAFEQAARELDAALAAEDAALLTLTEAARISGYSADHLGRLVKQGRIPNAGRPRAPRIHQGDLPRRAGRLPSAPASPMLVRAGQVARTVVTEEGRR